jgi:hypothetical protein
MKWAQRVALAVVIWAELSSLWVGFTDRERFTIAFPKAVGALYVTTQLTTAVVAVTAVMLWLGRRWAIPLNVAIGIWSVVLIQIAAGPIVNQLIVVIACTVTTSLSLAVARRAPVGAVK